MQFDAQHRYYTENYHDAPFQVIDGIDAGGTAIPGARSDEIRIIDIALLPEYRGRGLGTQLLRNIQTAAQQAVLPVTIHVERFNPALSLYERLGFRMIEDKGVYLLLKWMPVA